MHILRSEENGVTVLTLAGRLETATTVIYDNAYAEALTEGPRKLVLDCTNLTFISSTGLRSILRSLKQLSASKGKLAISSPTAMVMEVLEISGFKPLITICPTRDAAVAALA